MSVHEIPLNIPDPEVIAVIERILEDAKRGEVQSIAYVVSYGTYLTGNGWAGMGGDGQKQHGHRRRACGASARSCKYGHGAASRAARLL
ncbi:MAG: hypothetical protein H6926_08420 [Chromatiales bacterium]|nr:hypothetical protein [Gammaproteobacteria bacterium]MCP5353190.1 hypothetical protein [Chromatiales bacterium]